MKDGFLKVAAGTPEIRLADIVYNTASASAMIKQANANEAKILVLPELCLTGYGCGDLFTQSKLQKGALDALFALVETSTGSDTVCFAGLPLSLPGGGLYSCAAAIQNGRLLAVIPKTYSLSNAGAGIPRCFSPAPPEMGTISLFGYDVPFGSNIILQCHEPPFLRVSAELSCDLAAPLPPSSFHALSGATVIVNLFAAGGSVTSGRQLAQAISCQSKKLSCAYILAGAGSGDGSTDIVCQGPRIIAECGAIIASEESDSGLTVSEIDLQKSVRERQGTDHFRVRHGYVNINFPIDNINVTLTRKIHKNPFIPEAPAQAAARCEKILELQSAGLFRRMRHIGSKHVVLGLSGGLDSSLAALVCAKALDKAGLPRENLLAVTMPCFGTTQSTKSNAARLAASLGANLRSIDIGATVKSHFSDIDHSYENQNLVFENAQARERTQVLMDIANSCGGLAVGTGDLSELALGWATYGGDHLSMYGVNAGVPKTVVRRIVTHVMETTSSAELSETLHNILMTPVSPELLPPSHENITQKTEDLVGPYDLHDFFLYYTLRWGFAPLKIFRLANQAFFSEYDEITIRKWLTVFFKRFFSQQFKRSCMPDGPAVGSVSLSPRGAWNMPSDAQAALWLSDLDF